MKIKISRKKLTYLNKYLFVLITTGLILGTLFFALPKTESLLPDNFLEQNTRFDLNTKNENYWKREFLLKISPEQNVTEKDVNKTKDILYQRLRKYGVEEIQIVEQKVDKKDGLKVTVQTNKEFYPVSRLIYQTGSMELMLPKEDLKLEEEELDYSNIQFDGNYNSTKWDRNAFRNIAIKNLVDSTQNRSYFAIFKPWPQDQSRFREFIEENEGNFIGFSLDGIVRPIEINEHSKELFAVGIGPDSEEALFHDIILNTGVMPLEYNLYKQTQHEAETIEFDHLQITIAIILGIIILFAYLYFKTPHSKQRVVEFGLCLTFLFSTTFTILKVFQIPIDLFIIIIIAILAMIFTKMIYFRNNETRSIILLPITLCLIMMFFGTGYIMMFGQLLLITIILALVIQKIIEFYIANIKIIFK